MITPQGIMEAKQALGAQLAALRRVAGWRQEDLADKAFVSRSTIANIETGRQVSPREFWQRCDHMLNASGLLTSGYDHVRHMEAMYHQPSTAVNTVVTTNLDGIVGPTIAEASPQERGHTNEHIQRLGALINAHASAGPVSMQPTLMRTASHQPAAADSAADAYGLEEAVLDHSPDHSIVGLLDRMRLSLDQTLSLGSVSPLQVAMLEDVIAQRLHAYPTAQPVSMLTALGVDLRDVQVLAQRRQPAAIQARLSRLSTLIATMCADAFMRLGWVQEAAGWFRTARVAAEDALDDRLKVLVLAQASMLPYYYGNADQSLSLARQALAVSTARYSPTALAAASAARALARMGDRAAALEAIAYARRVFDQVGDPDGSEEAFRFTPKRLLLYLSGAHTNLGDTRSAYSVQNEAQQLYAATGGIDPVLLSIDRSSCLVTDGRVDEACQYTISALDRLPPSLRTDIVLTRAAAVPSTLPAHARRTRAVRELHDYLRTHGRPPVAGGADADGARRLG